MVNGFENLKGYSRIKIGDLAEVITGGTPSTRKSEYWENGNIPWLPSGECRDKEINSASKFITEDGMRNSSAKLMPKNTVIIALTGATTGKTGILNIEATANQSVTGIIPNNKFIPKYIFYYLRNIREKILHDSYGGAQKHISQGYVKDIEILLPSLEIQKRIVSILEKSEKALEKRKEAISLIDELVKSKFIEMFGNPVSNDREWNKEICSNISSKIGSGATPKGGNSSYKDEGISLIRSMNIYNNKFIDKDLAFIDDEQAGKLKNVIVEEDDVLLNITGASVARCCTVPKEYIPARVNQHVAIIRCKREAILPKFLEYELTNENYQRFLWDIATSGGATREAITKQQIENLDLIVPPIEIQNEFVKFVKQVDEMKLKMESSLKELEDNFNALMQRAFKGELF